MLGRGGDQVNGLLVGGASRPDETVVFLHTGGVPALFAYAEALAKDERT